jgi:hypothetical protein
LVSGQRLLDGQAFVENDLVNHTVILELNEDVVGIRVWRRERMVVRRQWS